MKRIIAVVLISIICFVGIDIIVGVVCDKALSHLPDEGERLAKSNYFIAKCDKDIVIIGSSRAQCNYDPNVIIDATGNYSVFNCGIDAQGFYYEIAALNALLDRYSPKAIIWDFRIDELESSKTEDLNLLYPYYYSNAYIHHFLDNIDSSLKYKLWSNSYRYNGLASRMINVIMSSKKETKLGFGSYSTTNQALHIEERSIVIERNDINQNKLQLLIKTLERIKQTNIHLYIVQSPLFHRYVGQSETDKILNVLSNTYQFVYINDSQLSEFVGKVDYIYDINHLNNNGASVFTEILMSQVKNLNQYDNEEAQL